MKQSKDISRRLSKIITQNIYASSAKLSANLPGNCTLLCVAGDRRPNCDQSPNRTYHVALSGEGSQIHQGHGATLMRDQFRNQNVTPMDGTHGFCSRESTPASRSSLRRNPAWFFDSSHMVNWLGWALFDFNRTVYQKSKRNLRFGTPTQRSIVVNLCIFSLLLGAEFSLGSRFPESAQHGRSFG